MMLKQKSEAERAFNMAVAFHEAAFRCTDPVHDPAIGANVYPLPAGVTCCALACELYLKALGLHSGRRVGHIHRLNVLFAKSDAERQKAISDHYANLTGGRDRASLETDLKSFANAFVDWRYIYENEDQRIEARALFAFAGSAYRATRDLIPEWSVTDYLHGRVTGDVHLVELANLGGGITQAVVARPKDPPVVDPAK